MIGNIQVSMPDDARIPLELSTTLAEQARAFIVNRENNERNIPIKFRVRGRHLEGMVKEAQERLAKTVSLGQGHWVEWHGEFAHLQDEKLQLAQTVPLTPVVIVLLVLFLLRSCWDAASVLFAVACDSVGGILALALTVTNFRMSALVGFFCRSASLCGAT